MSRDRDVGPIHACTLHTELRIDNAVYKQVVGGRPARYAPALSSPRGLRSALRRRADSNVAAVSHGQHVLTPTVAAS